MTPSHDSTNAPNPLQGNPVFPVVPNGRKPLTLHGFHDASNDPAQLARWRRQYPKCNWGMPTGHASGIVVIDVDAKHGRNGFGAWYALLDEFGDPQTLEASTASGGLHAYFLAPEGVILPNTGSENRCIAPGIDTRGDGGYVLIPPSKAFPGSTDEGVPDDTNPETNPPQPYTWIDVATPIQPLPDWLMAKWLAATQRKREDLALPSGTGAATDPSGDRPGDFFNARATWESVLIPHDWKIDHVRGGVTYWTRPGKTEGISATTNYADLDRLYVFSTSTDFDSEELISKFAAYTVLEHRGTDKEHFAAAAKALAAQGYGKPLEPRASYIPEEPGETSYEPPAGRNGQRPLPTARAERLEAYPNTDLGNAERLRDMFGRDLHYAPEIGWLYWTSTHWQRDSGDGKVHRLAFDVIRGMYQRAQALIKEVELSVQEKPAVPQAELDERRDKIDKAQLLLKWARKSEGRDRIKAAVGLCRYFANIQIAASDLDNDIWALNVLNGTLDLRTGALRPHRREDLLTSICHVPYDPAAKFEAWDAFLERILPDPQRRAFVQRAAGYSLTGSVREEKLFFAYGPTATGKSTFFRAVQSVMGEYTCTSSFESFLEKKNPGGIPNDIARLAGKRMVCSIEVESGQKLAEGLVKQITGGDVVSARFLHKEWFDFTPKFKLWLAANHRPRVRDDDDAIWRRIIQVPFNVQIPEKERDDKVKLALSDPKKAGPAVLAWMIAGCLNWQETGLDVPDSVKDATADYRAEMNPLRDFLDEYCVFGPGYMVKTTDFYNGYLEWAREVGQKYTLGRNTFKQRITDDSRVEEGRTEAIRFLRGVGLVKRA